MVFCGQCGLQLPPGNTTCPRCGSVTEPELAVEDLHTDDPTIVSISSTAPPTLQPQMEPPTPQQKLILRPDGNSPQHGTPLSSSEPETAIASYTAQHGGNYISPGTSYPGPPGIMGYSAVPGQFGANEPPRRSQRRGHSRMLTVLAFLLLLALAAIAVFAVRLDLLKGLPGNNVTPTVATTPSEQARTIIQQYYQDINNQDYQDAYNLWGTTFHTNNSFGSFTAGYAHTRHDDITINQLLPLPDGTVKAAITIVALEDNSSGTVTHTYKGLYVIGQENGAWKLLSGSFSKVG